MNNKIIDTINGKISDRVNEIIALFKKVRDVIGDNGYQRVVFDGKEWTLKSELQDSSDRLHRRNEIYAQCWVKDNDHPEGGFWYIKMISFPKKGWQWDCLADKNWDYCSTDIETLKKLKSCFDSESVDMLVIEQVLNAFVKSNKEVCDFFGI